MPVPLSRTVMVASPSPASATSSMRPPSPVYLAALLSRLATTCDSRAKSADSHTGAGGTDTLRVWARASISGRAVSTLCETMRASSTGSFLSAILPWLMRDTSSSSSTRRASRVTWRSTTSRAMVSFGSGGARRRITSTALRIGASGLRSSCDSMARNSSLRWFASCRRASASRERTISRSSDW